MPRRKTVQVGCVPGEIRAEKRKGPAKQPFRQLLGAYRFAVEKGKPSPPFKLPLV